MYIRNYWLVTAISWNNDHYDYFTVTVDTSEKCITKKAIEDCAKSIKESTGSEKVLITQVSYLGRMTEQEFNQ